MYIYIYIYVCIYLYEEGTESLARTGKLSSKTNMAVAARIFDFPNPEHKKSQIPNIANVHQVTSVNH